MFVIVFFTRRMRCEGFHPAVMHNTVSPRTLTTWCRVRDEMIRPLEYTHIIINANPDNKAIPITWLGEVDSWSSPSSGNELYSVLTPLLNAIDGVLSAFVFTGQYTGGRGEEDDGAKFMNFAYSGMMIVNAAPTKSPIPNTLIIFNLLPIEKYN